MFGVARNVRGREDHFSPITEGDHTEQVLLAQASHELDGGSLEHIHLVPPHGSGAIEGQAYVQGGRR